MIIISILLLIAPGLLAIKIAGQDKVQKWQDAVKAFVTWMVNDLLIVIFANGMIYLIKGSIQMNFSSVYMEQNIYNSIYYNTFIIRYGLCAVVGAIILGVMERCLIRALKRKGYIDKK